MQCLNVGNLKHTHRELVCSFPARAREFVEITNETVEWLLVTGYIVVNENGEIEKSKYVRNLNKIKYTSDEISDCLRKAERVGRWFAIMAPAIQTTSSKTIVNMV